MRDRCLQHHLTMEITIDLNSKPLTDALSDLAVKCGLELGPIVKQEAKYLIESAIRNTPPPDKAAGERTLGHDLSQVADALYYKTYEQKATGKGFYKSLARYIRDKDVEKMRALMRNPNFNLFKGMTLLGSEQEIRDRHYSRRVNGRVKQRVDAVAFSADYKRYWNTVKKRVGFMMSGWNQAAESVGAKKRAFASRTYEGNTSTVQFQFGRNPYFIAVNNNIRVPAFQKILNRAIAFRLKITTEKIEMAENKLAINLGFTRLAKGSY